MRRRRRELSASQRSAAAHAVAAHVSRIVHLRQGARIGAYLTTSFELDTGPLIELAYRRGWQVYVPVIVGPHFAQMRFAPLGGPLRPNRYGIPEPQTDPANWLSGRWLNLAFVPLLAVGPRGERLGAGAGFYDRAFSHRLNRHTWHKPPLVGIAYDCQRTESFPLADWDVPLDALITERAVYRITGSEE
jgi:5-formyltetrahydrofolate cyclo-ligase